MRRGRGGGGGGERGGGARGKGQRQRNERQRRQRQRRGTHTHSNTHSLPRRTRAARGSPPEAGRLPACGRPARDCGASAAAGDELPCGLPGCHGERCCLFPACLLPCCCHAAAMLLPCCSGLHLLTLNPPDPLLHPFMVPSKPSPRLLQPSTIRSRTPRLSEPSSGWPSARPPLPASRPLSGC